MDLVARAGTVLGGRYALEREIGRGGTASVYLAQDLRQRRQVAVKILRRDLVAGLGPERFLREIDIASRLTHPHILPVHDSGEADGRLFYVMPYVEGETLRDRIKREPRLPVDEALAITREIADALAYAHRRDVVHRDIKPANVLIQAGHAVVADFGVARAINAATDERVTGVGHIVGTPVYMSPEQAAGAALDGRTDVYSLGCVAYEMLTGVPPFLGASVREVVGHHLSSPLVPVRARRPEVPAPVAAAIEKALAKRPEQRFADARAFADALRAPGGWDATPKWRSRRSALIAVAAAFAVAGAVAAGMMLARGTPAAKAAGPVQIVVLPLAGDTLPLVGGAPRAREQFTELIDWIPNLRAADAPGLVPPGVSWPDVPLPDLLRRARSLGGRYVLAGSLAPGADGSPGRRLTLDLFDATTGDRLSHAADTADGAGLDGPIGRLAAGLVGTVTRREGLALGAAAAVLASTSVLPAMGHLLQAQSRFWAGDLDGAAAELATAIAADSSCGLAYLRLAESRRLEHDAPAALAAVEAGLARSDVAPRWRQLLRAERYLVLGYGDSATATFQSAVLDRRDDIDGWLGLGEALVHYAAFSGASPQDARPAFDRMAALDSSFAPLYYHLVDLAVYAGDSAAAVAALGRMRTDQPYWPAKRASIRLRFGPPSERAAALAALQSSDRQAISEAALSWAHGAFNLSLADTAASFLLGADRVPDDRLRGAQYRLAIRAALGRWREGYAGWDSVAHGSVFDPWIVSAALAGLPAGDRAAPMFAWARTQLATGSLPDFSLPPWDDRRQGFEALVYRALLEGDSAETRGLLRRVELAAAPPADPAPDNLRWTLQARLALLAHDSAGAVAALQRAVARVAEPYTANYPLTALGPQRRLLGRLLAARGDTAGAERWRRSFRRSWAVADLLYLPALDSLPSSPPRSAR